MRKIRFLFAVAAIIVTTPSAFAQTQERFQIGFRPTVVTASGIPANDMMSLGVYGRYRLSERSLIGAAVDEAEYDFELPWRVVGLEQAGGGEPIDALTSSTIISAWFEREHGRVTSPWKLFWSLGAGTASPEVDDVSGPVDGGGTFDLETDAGTEILALGSAGIRRNLGRWLAAEFVLRADHHFAEWKVRDRVSGRTGTTHDYTGLGAHVGFAARF